ncbi:iron ABC transporter permease [Bacillus zhangzhouensis]|nr:iron ABC transporter permease [Bacillus zhangzhouensis]
MLSKKRKVIVYSILMSILCFMVLISLGIGAVAIHPMTVLTNLLGFNKDQSFIIFEYRLPRVFLAVLSGAGFAVSGAILQGVVRNSLASPDVVGVTKGAGVGAMLIILLVPTAPVFLLPIAAFIGAGLAAASLLFFTIKYRMQPASLAMTGIAIGALCQAVMQYMMVKFPGDVNAALIWLAGSLFGRGYDQLYVLVLCFMVLFPIVWMLKDKLDVLLLHDQLVKGLGESPKGTRILWIVIAVLIAGSCVAAVGSIGFIGLIGPHIARRITSSKAKELLPLSAIVGAILLLSADTLGRTIIAPVEIPAGILTAVLGAPYFLYLLRHESRTR